jgi:hypothetical protein
MKRHAALIALFACLGGCVDLTGPAKRPSSMEPDARGPDAAKDVRPAEGPPPASDMGSGGQGGEPATSPPDAEPPEVMPPAEVTPPVDAPAAEVPLPPPANKAPIVVSSGGPGSTTGTSVVLSVLGSDDHGEANLIYTWATKGAAPGPVGFSVNGDNAAKNVTLLFTAAGSYQLEVVIRDAEGLTVSLPRTVQVDQAPNDISISPTMAALSAGGMQQFTAKIFDQFGAPLAVQTTPSYSLIGSCGTLSPGGLLVASVGAGATCTVIAAINGASDPAAVTVGGALPMVLAPVADAYVDESNSDKNFGREQTVLVKSQDGAENTRLAYLRFALPGAGASKAILRLYGRSANTTNKDTLVSVSDNSWSETGITWKNHPSQGTSRGSVLVTTTAKYREWDVTTAIMQSYLAGSTQVSFALRMDSSTLNSPDAFNAREASSNLPELVITP